MHKYDGHEEREARKTKAVGFTFGRSEKAHKSAFNTFAGQKKKLAPEATNTPCRMFPGSAPAWKQAISTDGVMHSVLC